MITCHAGGMFPNMPYPVKKLTNVGWHGVQLFFLVSCVTLMMSWRSDERKGIANPLSFWIRRFFRIAPMYYLGALFYFIAEPPASGFDFGQMLASLTFVNAWHPNLVPTTAGRWMVVPGGWSIGVEFTFYLLFPFLAVNIRRISTAIAAFVVAVLLACVANTAAGDAFRPLYGNVATENFLYFWLPNQLPIFALGGILYFAIINLRDQNSGLVAFLRERHQSLIALCVIVFIVVAELPNLASFYFSVAPVHLMPHLLVAALLFMASALLLALNAKSPLINRAICALGQVSFSAYILHFFFLHKLTEWLPLVDSRRGGYRAIADLVLLWAIAVPCTFAASKVTYEAIEKPMIRLGALVGQLVRPPAPASEQPVAQAVPRSAD